MIKIENPQDLFRLCEAFSSIQYPDFHEILKEELKIATEPEIKKAWEIFQLDRLGFIIKRKDYSIASRLLSLAVHLTHTEKPNEKFAKKRHQVPLR